MFKLISEINPTGFKVNKYSWINLLNHCFYIPPFDKKPLAYNVKITINKISTIQFNAPKVGKQENTYVVYLS